MFITIIFVNTMKYSSKTTLILFRLGYFLILFRLGYFCLIKAGVFPPPMILPLVLRQGSVIHVLSLTFQGLLIKKIDLLFQWLGCKGGFQISSKSRQKNIKNNYFNFGQILIVTHVITSFFKGFSNIQCLALKFTTMMLKK